MRSMAATGGAGSEGGPAHAMAHTPCGHRIPDIATGSGGRIAVQKPAAELIAGSASRQTYGRGCLGLWGRYGVAARAPVDGSGAPCSATGGMGDHTASETATETRAAPATGGGFGGARPKQCTLVSGVWTGLAGQPCGASERRPQSGPDQGDNGNRHLHPSCDGESRYLGGSFAFFLQFHLAWPGSCGTGKAHPPHSGLEAFDLPFRH